MISVLVPTRKRPSNMLRLFKSISNTVNDIKNIEIISYIDDDDDDSAPALEKISKQIKTTVFRGPRTSLSEAFNQLAFTVKDGIIMYCADDIVFHTKNWDLLIQNKFDKYDDKILLAYGNDGFLKEKCATHGFIHKNWINVVGYLLTPKLKNLYTDAYLSDVAQKIGRLCYIPELFTEHLHPEINKSKKDETYTTRSDFPLDDILKMFFGELAQDRTNDANKLIQFIQNFQTSYGYISHSKPK